MSDIKFSEICNFLPKQLEAVQLADKYKYFLYGGSRGPGKSFFLRWYGLRELLRLAYEGITKATVGLFCEDYPSLTDRQTNKIAKEFPDWLGELKDSKIGGFGFYIRPEYGGGFLALRNLDDVSKYQSAEFAAILVDELTKNEKDVFDILKGSLRWKGVDSPKFVAASNPGGKGHVWTKKEWGIRGIHIEPIIFGDHAYLPALPEDNPYLGNSYWEMLDTLPERLKRAWKLGDWSAFEGQFFSFDESRQLIEPFEIPGEWNLIGSLDPGYSSPCSFSISAIDFEKNLYRIATYYESNRSPKEHSAAIKSFINNLSFTKGRMPSMIIADPSAWAKRDKYAIVNSESTFADVMLQSGIFLMKGLNDRVQGWWAMKDLMGRVQNGKPKYYVFNYMNKSYLEQLQSAMGDENNPEDIQGRGNDPTVEDHCLDEERYKLMAIYKPIPKTEAEKVAEERKRLSRKEVLEYQEQTGDYTF